MEADLPMQQISELFNINHFIVSQVSDISCDVPDIMRMTNVLFFVWTARASLSIPLGGGGLVQPLRTPSCPSLLFYIFAVG